MAGLARIVVSSTALALALGCAGRVRVVPTLDTTRLPFRVDSSRSELLAQGVAHHYLYAGEGPWAIHLFDITPSSCIGFRALKAHRSAAGREPATWMLEQLDEDARVIGGVNADFFSLATGVPVSTHIENGRVIAGPAVRPVFAFDSAGTPFIGTLRATGRVLIKHETATLNGWNRVVENGLAVVDRAWGAATDSGTGRIEVLLSGGTVVGRDTLVAGAAIPPSGVVLVAGRNAPESVKQLLTSLQVGDTVTFDHGIQPIAPREAVGGWPIILRDGQILIAVDSAGATFAPVRHPRTAVGLFPDGRIVFLVVDGRQKPYSDGMTLRELARVFQSLGARDAINLDGGGSSTFVIRDALGVMRIQNRPSDKTERAVANVLAIVDRCGG